MYLRLKNYRDNTNNSAVRIVFEIKENEVAGQEPVVIVKQEKSVGLSPNYPSAILADDYEMHRPPSSVLEFNALQKQWNVLRSLCVLPKDATFDIYPVQGRHIVALVQGHAWPVEGIVGTHERILGDQHASDTVFMALYREKEAAFMHSAAMPLVVNRGKEPQEEMMFVPWEWNSVFAWAYVSFDGQLIPPIRNPPMRWYVDCEFEDSTKTLLSVGIVTHEGAKYYAYDSEAISKVTEHWVRENVCELAKVHPPETKIYSLADWRAADQPIKTFSDFLEVVHSLEYHKHMFGHGLEINVDFTTDIEYISGLFHIGHGERICPQAGISFKMHGIDSYPTKMEGALQHHALWDAMVLHSVLGADLMYAREIDSPEETEKKRREWDLEIKAMRDRFRDVQARKAEAMARGVIVLPKTTDGGPEMSSGDNMRHMREGIERLMSHGIGMRQTGKATSAFNASMKELEKFEGEEGDIVRRWLNDNTAPIATSDESSFHSGPVLTKLAESVLGTITAADISGSTSASSIKEHADAALLISLTGSPKTTEGQVLNFRQGRVRNPIGNSKLWYGVTSFEIPKDGYDDPDKDK